MSDPAPTPSRAVGHVEWFSDAKNYGFIRSSSCPGRDIFVHYTAIQVPGHKRLKEGQMVVFELEINAKGKPTAQCVVPVRVLDDADD